MINYSEIVGILESKQYVDKTDCFEMILSHRHSAFENCKGTGSSLFLKSLACFLDETIDTKNIFSKLKIAKTQCFFEEVNSYEVLFMDFSDIDPMCFDEAVEIIRTKMTELYMQFCRCFEPSDNPYYDYRLHEKALDIIEGKVSFDNLKCALHNLLFQLKFYCHHNGKKLALLIDNMVSLETIAAKKGFSKEMRDFLDSFIVEDIYKHTDYFLIFSDCAEENNEYARFHTFETYRRFCVFPLDIKKRAKELIVSVECQHIFDYKPIPTRKEEWNDYTKTGRIDIKQAIIKKEHDRQEQIKKEKTRFAVELAPYVPRFSPNLGIRKKSLDKSTPQYAALNALLKDLFSICHTDPSTNNIYSHLQIIHKDSRIVQDSTGLIDTLKRLPIGNPCWSGKSSVQDSGYWIQTIYNRTDGDGSMPNKPENIKVYACFNHIDIQEIFVQSIKHLITFDGKSFAAKIAKIDRSDQMCYWISADDFKHLESFFKPYFENMKKSLPFIAYKGMIGISKDFPGIDDSHNSTQAHIIADYFKTVGNVENIDLEDMYNNYIAKWNADIYEELEYGGFKNNSALSFIVIMDSLDAILGSTKITDGSPLLLHDRRYWEILASSRCWADINEKWETAERCIFSLE